MATVGVTSVSGIAGATTVDGSVGSAVEAQLQARVRESETDEAIRDTIESHARPVVDELVADGVIESADAFPLDRRTLERLSYCGGHTIPEARENAEFVRVAQDAKEREGAHFDRDWESVHVDSVAEAVAADD